jgi:hypothetical protein
VTGCRFEAPGGFLRDAEVGVFFDLERRAQEAKLVLQIYICLQRLKARQPVGVAVVVFLREDPVLVEGRFLLGGLGDDLKRPLAMRGVAQVTERVQIALAPTARGWLTISAS